MKRFLKITAWVLGLVLLLLGGTAAWINYSAIPTYDTPIISDLKVEITPDRIARGAKLASVQCVACHLGSDGKLSGQQMLDVPKEFGKLYSFNITQHPEKGIGKWSDGEIYTMLRTGLRKDGSFNGIMPKFPNMADEDLYAIIAWLRSNDPKVQAAEKTNHPQEYTLLTKGLLKFAFKPLPPPQQPIVLPDTTNQIAWGRYLANGALTCFGCHSADFKTVNDLEPEKSGGFYGGGNPMLNLEGQVVASANLTPDSETGIGKWTEAQFVATLKTMHRPDGKMLRYPMIPYGVLTDGEIKAIYAYLRTVPPIKNEVPRNWH